MFITSIQLVQMVVGCVVNYIVYVMKEDGLECHVSDRNIKVQLRYPNIVQCLKIILDPSVNSNFPYSFLVVVSDVYQLFRSVWTLFLPCISCYC